MAKPRVPKSPSDEISVNTAMEAAATTPVAAEANGNGSSQKTVRRKTTAKPEIVRTDTRTNLVPINVEDEIRRLAYLLSERRGFEPGHEADDWFAAEREVRQRYHQHSA